MSLTPQELLDQALRLALPDQPLTHIGVAISGGSDSTALLGLVTDWAARNACTVRAATVDHGLRPEARDEARQVAKHCAEIGVAHEILRWENPTTGGNLQDQARQARYAILSDWAAANRIDHIALGHTMDDQAETVLMRLARGAGVDGLSAMSARRRAHGVIWLRPLLGCKRADLRTYLRKHGLGWIDDPSNFDPKYDRVKIRNALKLLDGLSISAQGLAATAARMAMAREVLEQATQQAAKTLVHLRGGAAVFARDGLFDLLPETRRRLLAHMLRWMSNTPYPPRSASLERLQFQIQSGVTSTLHGCLITIQGDTCTLSREPAALIGTTCEPGQIWDNRWRLTGPNLPGQHIGVLGEKGLVSCDNWRDAGLDRNVLLCSPAVWHKDELIAAPVAGFANGWVAELVQDATHFVASVKSH